MSFKLETTDIDLGDTPIENIFINDFMPMADGTYVKVYLLGFKYAHDKDSDIEVDNETIAKHLDIPLSDVLRAWDFWKDKGIIEKLPKSDGNKYDYEVKFLNLKQLYIKNNYKPITAVSNVEQHSSGYVCSEEDLIEANDIVPINKMFNSIDYIMRRQLVPNEKKKVLEWIYNYNMNPDMVVKAFFYAIEKKGIKNVNYVEGIIRNWYDDGITNVEALQQKFKKTDERYYRYDRIMKYLGLGNRLPTESEMNVIDKWFESYKFSLELVLKACENSKKTSNPSINYIDGILTSWHGKGISTVDEIEEKDKPLKNEQYKDKKTYQRTTGKAAKTRFHNFEQRTSKYTSDELEEIARKKREEYYFKSKGE
ncbi:DnaD domain protein [Anaerosalibacter sp. Marseille-P3206]|uniref:DnaD domain protein n=1 Tax=Anaerosalibacter sp. Marseille-P3206 TaxID=1871005 RepID=UPI000984A984|nr:DnaD domain protein [Anaerosalibacter sp. Marseille-P3206]